MKKTIKRFFTVVLVMLPLMLGLVNGKCNLFEIFFFNPCNGDPNANFSSSAIYYDGGYMYTSLNSIYQEDDYCTGLTKLATISGTTLNYSLLGFWHSYNLVFGSQGVIAKSSESIPAWTTVNSGTTNTLNKAFLNPGENFLDLIWAVGNNGTVIFSNDFGLNWTPKNFPLNVDLNDVEADSYDTNFVRVVGDDMTAYYTTDGGNTWIDDSLYGVGDLSSLGIDMSRGGPNLNAVNFVDANTGYIAGEFGVIFKTTTGGEIYFPGIIPGLNNITDIHFFAPDSGFAVTDDGEMRYTHDGGINWYEDTTVTGLLNGSSVNNIIPYGDWGIVVADSGKYFLLARDSLSLGINNNTNGLPAEFLLAQNYPNPFNPTTNIRYNIPRVSQVTLQVYDVAGREVEQLVNEQKLPGDYIVTFSGIGLPSGVYFYRIQAGEYTETKKMILLK